MPTPDEDAAADPVPAPAAVSSATLRQQIAQIEQTIAGLTDAAAAAGVRSYAEPDNPKLRHAADLAMAALHSAQQELERLRIALPAAEQQEAEAAAAAAQAKRQKAKDKLIRARDRLYDLASDEFDKHEAAVAKLPAAEAECGELQRRLNNAQIRVDVLIEQCDNAAAHSEEYMDQADALDAQIAAFPVTAAEVEAAEATADEEARRAFEADCAAQIDALRAEQAAARGAEMVAVEPPLRVLPDGPYNGWSFNSGLVVAVPRRDLALLEAEKHRFEEAAEVARRPATRHPEPWRYIQGPPYCYGRETAIRVWASSRALPADISFALEAARERNDSMAVNILAEFVGHSRVAFAGLPEAAFCSPDFAFAADEALR